MFFLQAIAFIISLLLVASLNIKLPFPLGLYVFKTLTAMFFFIAGNIVFGCNTFAPKKASSDASAKLTCSFVFAFFTTLGSAVIIPSASVHIWISFAFIAAPIMAAV